MRFPLNFCKKYIFERTPPKFLKAAFFKKNNRTTTVHEFYKKKIFCLILNFLNIILEFGLGFLNTIPLIFLVKFNTSSKRPHMLTPVSNFTNYI